jgi:hypothetical protein
MKTNIIYFFLIIFYNNLLFSSWQNGISKTMEKIISSIDSIDIKNFLFMESNQNFLSKTTNKTDLIINTINFDKNTENENKNDFKNFFLFIPKYHEILNQFFSENDRFIKDYLKTIEYVDPYYLNMNNEFLEKFTAENTNIIAHGKLDLINFYKLRKNEILIYFYECLKKNNINCSEEIKHFLGIVFDSFIKSNIINALDYGTSLCSCIFLLETLCSDYILLSEISIKNRRKYYLSGYLF